MLLDTIDGGKQEKLAYYFVEEKGVLAEASLPNPSCVGWIRTQHSLDPSGALRPQCQEERA